MSHRLHLLSQHLTANPLLFKGPIADSKWDYDASKVQINLEEARRLYNMSIPKEQAQMLEILKNDPLFE